LITSYISEGLPWDDNFFKLFISHLAIYKSFAEELQHSLEIYNITAFVAHKDIKPSQDWEEEIKDRLRTCDSLIAILHSDFHNSDWTDQEIGIAIGLNKMVASINLGSMPYGFLERFQALNGNGKVSNQIAQEIYEMLRDNKATQKKYQERLLKNLLNQIVLMQRKKIFY